LRLDVPVTVVAAGTAIGLGAASGSLVTTCRLCGSNGLDDAMRSALRRNDPAPAGVVSDVTVVSAPFVSVGLLALAAHDEGHLEQAPLDALLVGEATAVAMVLGAVTRVAFAREGPAGSVSPAAAAASDAHTSFVSSHTTFVFALAASAGTVAHLRGYRLEPLVWGVGVPLALATSYLEVAADRAHFTDAVGGMALGTLVGIGVPWLFHGPVSEKLSVSASPVPGGQMLTVAWRGL